MLKTSAWRNMCPRDTETHTASNKRKFGPAMACGRPIYSQQEEAFYHEGKTVEDVANEISKKRIYFG
jgi:hypothetical protein